MATLFTRNVWLLLIAASIVILFLYSTGYGSVKKKDVSKPKKTLKWGRKIIYKPLEGCEKQELLTSYNNPCWKSPESKITCAARVVLLGFQKSGTSDLSSWFYKDDQTLSANGDLFFDKTRKLTTLCPLKWLESFGQYGSEQQSKTVFYDCPGCILMNDIVGFNSTLVIRQSVIQYLQYAMVDSSRYIITMREPADRMISDFFYTHKEQRANNPYREYSVEEVGNSFFHKLVSNTVEYMTKCLQTNGTSVCVLAKHAILKFHPHPFVSNAVILSCYVPFIKEVLRFIPQEKIYFSKLEEYSEHEIESMKKIFTFVGLSTDSLEKTEESKLVKGRRNAGYNSKPVLPETIQLLKEFFQPYNLELVKLLKDDKWSWA